MSELPEQINNSEKEDFGFVTPEKDLPIFDKQHRDFSPVVHYMGEWYEARDSDGSICHYRRGNQSIDSDVPHWIHVDTNGKVLKRLGVDGKPWESK